MTVVTYKGMLLYCTGVLGPLFVHLIKLASLSGTSIVCLWNEVTQRLQYHLGSGLDKNVELESHEGSRLTFSL